MKLAICATMAFYLSILSGLSATPPVTISAANTYFSALPAETRAIIPANSTGEIQAIANGLENDPALIVAYVRNNFRYVPYYGHMKGPHEILMDQAGNDYDLTRLTVELLRAAGHSASYVRGTISYPLATAASWLGVSGSQVSLLLSEAGIPHNPPSSSIAIERIWVSVNGVNVDPAFKEMRRNGGVSVGSMMGYNQNDLLNGAGGELGTNWARNVNTSNVEGRLQIWTTNFLNALKTSYPKASISDIVGGDEIIPLVISKGNLSALAIGASGTSFNQPDPKRMHTVKVTVGTDARIINMSDIDGRIFHIGTAPGSPQPPRQTPLKLHDFASARALNTYVAGAGQYAFPPTIQGGKVNYFTFTVNKTRYNSQTDGSDNVALIGTNASAFRMFVTDAGGVPPIDIAGVGVANFVTSGTGANSSYTKDIHVYLRNDVAPGTYQANVRVIDYYENRSPSETITYLIPLTAYVVANDIMQLKVGDAVLWNDSSVSAFDRLTNYDFTAGVNHPYPAYSGTHGDQTLDPARTRKVFRGSSYVFLAQGGDTSRTGRRVSDRLERCQALLNAGAHPESEEVVLNTLSAFGSQYLTESELQENLTAKMSNAVLFYHHQFAIAKRAPGYVMDHILLSARAIGRDGSVDDNQLFALGSMFGSALEHASYEQFQDNQSVSTIKALYLANAAGQKIYKVDKNSLPSIRSELTGYSADDLNWYQQRANAENLTYVMHQNGSTVVNEWSDHGYIEIWPYGGRGMMVGGGFNYWNTVYGGVASTRAWESQSTRMQRMMREHRRRLHHARRSAMSAEPVDLKTGAYVYNMTELTVGTAAPPRGLDFQRSYNSDAAMLNGPLGRGWDHNWNSLIETSSDPRIAMGMRQPADAAAWIVAAHAMHSLITSNTDTPRGLVVQVIIAKWAADQLKDNSTAVKLAGEWTVFCRQPDGSYTPPPGSKLTLENNGASGHLLKNRFGTTFTYNATGKLTGITDIHNKSLTVGWTGELVSSVTDAYNRRLDFNYGGDALLDTVTDTTGRSMSFTYLNGNLATFVDPDANVFRYAYDAQNRLQTFRNGENEVVAINHYDARGKVDYQDSEGNTSKRWRFFNTPFRTVQQDPQGGQTIYEYDRLGNQFAETDALGNRQTFEYNVHNLLTSAVDAKGQRREFDYDNHQNLLVARSFDNGVPVEVVSTYDSLNRKDSVTNANEHAVNYHYNALHELEWEEDPDGKRTTYTYYPIGHAAAGKVETVTVPCENGATHPTTYFYDAFGQPDRIDYPDDTSDDYTYNSRGDLTVYLDRKVNRWEYFYHNRRLLHREVDPNTAEKIYTYNSYGKVLTARDRNGNLTVNTYYPSGHIKDSTNGELEPTLYRYDSRDWLQRVISPEGNELETRYYANGWVKEVDDPLDQTTSFFYQANGNREIVKNALLQDTIYSFDSLNRVKTVKNHRNEIAVNTLDPAGNTTHLKNGRNQEAESVFDPLNRPTDFYTPLRRHTHRDYSPRGKLTSLTEPSTENVTFHYDAVGRLDDRTDPEGLIDYEYDDNGNLETVTEGTKVITRNYDNLNRLQLYRNAEGEEIEYRYYPEGNLWKLIYPDKTKIVEYTYDDANRLKTVKDWNNRLTTYNWDDDGRLESIERHNDTRREIAYDNSGNTTAIKEIGGAGRLLAYFKFERDPLGRIKHEMRGPRPPPFQTAVQNATFDEDDRLATFNGQSVTHDADGNMTHAPVIGDQWRDFNYDSRNRLRSVDSIAIWENIYDAEGIRVEVRDQNQPTKFVVSPGTLPKTLVQINPDNTRRYFVYGLGLLYHIDDAETSPTTTTYHYNGQGSTVALSNDSGVAVGRFHYDPYGLVAGKEGNTDTIFQFNGHYGIATDPTGLVHLNARFYNPHLKRFVNSDPAGFAGGMNWFAYSSGDPINLFDPLGLGPADSERYTWIDGMQDGIGMAGMIPGLGVFPDGANVLISLLRGNYGDAAFNATAMIPLVGDGLMAAKWADRANDALKIAGRASDGADDAAKYLYHYTNPNSADNILANGFDTRFSSDGALYFTNKGDLSPIQAQIELALPANRPLPGSLLKIDIGALEKAGINPSVGPRRVQGNLPGLGAGGGHEFLFNQNIPSQFIQKVK